MGVLRPLFSVVLVSAVHAELHVKFVLVGDSGVGKTQLLRRFGKELSSRVAVDNEHGVQYP